jgi:hypothetical protein
VAKKVRCTAQLLSGLYGVCLTPCSFDFVMLDSRGLSFQKKLELIIVHAFAYRLLKEPGLLPASRGHLQFSYHEN